jgi:hypothetical protein
MPPLRSAAPFSAVPVQGTRVAAPASAAAQPVSVESAPRPEGVGSTAYSAPTPADLRLRQLGLDPLKRVTLGGKDLPASKIMDVLGPTRMVPVPLVNTPGRVMWVDFDLARELGFNVPPGNRMTPAFEKELTAALSFRVAKEGEDTTGKSVVTGAADRYMGTGMGYSQGAGRAAFLPALNANIKGLGRTPLAAQNKNQDFTHNHGGAPAREGLLEAAWGLESQNLFSNKGARILAVIDTGDNTEWADGTKEPRALIVRVGNQYRPAHILSGIKFGQQGYHDPTGGAFSKDVFVNMARESGFLVAKNGKPDLRATMLQAVDKQALLSAEQFRNRVLHGAVSTSNMQWDGGALDHGTTTSLMRTAPAKVLAHTAGFGGEHQARTQELARVYTALTGSLSREERASLGTAPIDFKVEMENAYQRHLAAQTIDATGLKGELGVALTQEQPGLALKFCASVQALAGLRNVDLVNVDKQSDQDASMVDVFNMLRELPATYFQKPDADLKGTIKELLLPRILGSSAEKARKEKALDAAVAQFAPLYAQVMQAASSMGSRFYDDTAALQRSVVARARFENAPMNLMQRSALHDKMNDAINTFRANAANTSDGEVVDTRAITGMVDKTVASSLRSTEQLMRQGSVRPLENGAWDVGVRTMDGMTHSVRAFPDGRRRLHVSIPVTGNDATGYTMPTLQVNHVKGAPHLQRDQIEALRYHFSTDGWQTSQQVGAQLSKDAEGNPCVAFDIPMLGGDVGTLEGVFHCTARGDFWWKDGASNFRGYAFAVPDRAELDALVGAAA